MFCCVLFVCLFLICQLLWILSNTHVGTHIHGLTQLHIIAHACIYIYTHIYIYIYHNTIQMGLPKQKIIYIYIYIYIYIIIYNRQEGRDSGDLGDS